jgi:4-amino-4-deoxy-L-arabinose transferase-like glycosyltransferase
MLAAGLASGLAVLTKGPVGLLLFLLTAGITWASFRFRRMFRIADPLIFVFTFIAASCLWYLPELIQHGPWFFKEFIRYQVELFSQPVAGHGQPFYYHFLIVFIGCFPMSVYALPAFTGKGGEDEKMPMRRWMMVLFWVVMILFSIVRTKIVHYSSMAYLPLSYLAAGYLYEVYTGQRQLRRAMLIITGSMGLLFSILILALPILFYYKSLLYPYLRDPFALASLQQPVGWTGWEWVFGLVFLACWLGVWRLMRRGDVLRGLTVYALSMALVLTAYLKMVIPRIEQYSQGAAITFYESIRGEDVYVTTVGFKSYAYLFYFRQPLMPDHAHRTDKNWLIDGDIDKPAYFVTKNTEKYLKDFPKVEKIDERGGFIFYRRIPATN